MPAFADWLSRVLTDGESVHHDPPHFSSADRVPVRRLLAEAFADAALDVAGPPLDFQPEIAESAAVLLAAACWRMASGEVVPLPPLPEPDGPAAHLSADVPLRCLPSVHRRAKTTNTPLAEDVAGVLRRFPLSGVRADLDGSPTSPLTFGCHPGLMQLYAERLAANPRSGWLPPPGPAREWAERIFAERNVPLPIDTGEQPRE